MDSKKKRVKYNLSDLKTLGHQLLTSKSHINNLPILVSFITPDSPPHYALESLLSLQSFFTPLLPQILSSIPSKTSYESNPHPEFVYRTWLRSKFDHFLYCLNHVAVSSKSDDALREVVLDALMEFVKVGNAGKFHTAIYYKLLRAIVHSKLGFDDSLLDLLATKYFNFIDVRYFTYISLEKLVRTLDQKGVSPVSMRDRNGSPDVEDQSPPRVSMESAIHKIYYLLSHIPPLEASEKRVDHEMWNGLGIFIEKSNNKENVNQEDSQDKSKNSNDKVFSSRNVAKKMKPKFTKAWISFLSLPLSLDVYKEVLVTLHEAKFFLLLDSCWKKIITSSNIFGCYFL